MNDIIFTIDVEQDISKYLNNSYLGITEGIPKILDQFELFDIKANFFTTADVCLRYPEIMDQIIAYGHIIGCHSYDHSVNYFGKENFSKQLNDLSRATDVLTKAVGYKPTSFRAPNFSINGDTVRALDKLGYTIDSSILPGRKVKKFKVFTLLDYTAVNMGIYNPSYSDARIPGESKIKEVPLTENPLAKGSPLGLGFLNAFGFEKVKEALNNVNGDYIMFLIHPWEAINLGKYYPELKPWLHRACSGDMAQFYEFIEYTNNKYTFSTIEDIV
jgi:peptidoglycan/xylan/chitin deacetylase (PgdA/CDA1 family)